MITNPFLARNTIAIPNIRPQSHIGKMMQLTDINVTDIPKLEFIITKQGTMYPVSKVKEGDAKKIVDLEQRIKESEFNDYHFGEARKLVENFIEGNLHSRNSHLLKVQNERGQIIGSGFLSPSYLRTNGPRTGIVSDIFVDKNYRNQGIGTSITKKLIEKAPDLGYGQLILGVENPIAKSIYAKLDFQELSDDSEEKKEITKILGPKADPKVTWMKKKLSFSRLV